MSFRPTDLRDFDVAREVRIETNGPGGRVHSTVIWVMVDADEMYVRSVRGPSARWYGEALADPHVEIVDMDRRLEAVAVPVGDDVTIRRVNDLLEARYRGADGYEEMLTPEAQRATLRLEARFPGEQPLQAPDNLGAGDPGFLGPPVEVASLDGGSPMGENVILQPRKPV